MTCSRCTLVLMTMFMSASLPAAMSRQWDVQAPGMPQPFLKSVVARPDTEESMLTVTKDLSTIYWGVSERWFPMSRMSEIWTATQEGGQWRPRRAPFSNGYSDGDPFVSPDGKSLYFASMRPVGRPRKDFDLYMVERGSDGFGRPVNLGEAVNSPEDELYPSVDRHGTLYFGSERSGTWKIYRARRAQSGTYGEVQELPAPVNSAGSWNFNPFVTPDGRTLVFTSQRQGGYGKGDIWAADLGPNGEVRDVRNLGANVNTPEEEFHPTVSPGGRALFFVRRNTSIPAGNADLMWVSTKTAGLQHLSDRADDREGPPSRSTSR